MICSLEAGNRSQRSAISEGVKNLQRPLRNFWSSLVEFARDWSGLVEIAQDSLPLPAGLGTSRQ